MLPICKNKEQDYNNQRHQGREDPDDGCDNQNRDNQCQYPPKPFSLAMVAFSPMANSIANAIPITFNTPPVLSQHLHIKLPTRLTSCRLSIHHRAAAFLSRIIFPKPSRWVFSNKCGIGRVIPIFTESAFRDMAMLDIHQLHLAHLNKIVQVLILP